MKELVASDAATVEALTARLKQARTIAEFQRIQCVLMRATTDCSASQIAQVLGWATASVHITHSRWAREGEALFELKGKGGRRSHNLTEAEEAEVLAPFVEQATAGNVPKPPTSRRPTRRGWAKECPTTPSTACSSAMAGASSRRGHAIPRRT